MDNPAGYLYRVGQSKARPHLRWTQRWGAFPAVDRSVLGSDGATVDLLRALRRVSVQQRVAIVLVKCHGHTYAEAAELMGVAETAVTNHVHRGLARLRAHMEGE
ncbi:MAG: RNA polymerase sigma factor [Ilumatobacteraceae bacterium]